MEFTIVAQWIIIIIFNTSTGVYKVCKHNYLNEYIDSKQIGF